MVQISNFLDLSFTLKKRTDIANFSILTPGQTEHSKNVNSIAVRHLLNNNHEDSTHYINILVKTSKTDQVNETYWCPTPQNPGNGREHMPTQARILNESRELEKLEQLNPQENIYSRKRIFSNINCTDSTLEPEAKQAVETLIIDLHDNFARHRIDFGTKNSVQSVPHTIGRQVR